MYELSVFILDTDKQVPCQTAKTRIRRILSVSALFSKIKHVSGTSMQSILRILLAFCDL